MIKVEIANNLEVNTCYNCKDTKHFIYKLTVNKKVINMCRECLAELSGKIDDFFMDFE